LSKKTQLASITAQDLLLRAAPIVRSRNLLAKWYYTPLSDEIRKAKLIKYENDIPCVTYRSCELRRDNEPFENFRGDLPDCGGIYIPECDLQSVPGKISDRGDVFRVPRILGDDLDVVGHIARRYYLNNIDHRSVKACSLWGEFIGE
jgi:hypothetical protein